MDYLKYSFVVEKKDSGDKEIVSTFLDFLGLHPVVKKFAREWFKNPDKPLEKKSFIIRKQESFELIK